MLRLALLALKMLNAHFTKLDTLYYSPHEEKGEDGADLNSNSNLKPQTFMPTLVPKLFSNLAPVSLLFPAIFAQSYRRIQPLI